MIRSEQSALDGLDMFEKFGSRETLPNGMKTYRLLAESVMFHPKEHLTDRLLNRFLDVFEKIAVKDLSCIGFGICAVFF